MATDLIFRVKFTEHNETFVVFCKFISEESLVGFLELDEIFIPESALTEDDSPAMDALKKDLSGVQRMYLPLHVIIRVDEVEMVPRVALHEANQPTNIRPIRKDV